MSAIPAARIKTGLPASAEMSPVDVESLRKDFGDALAVYTGAAYNHLSEKFHTFCSCCGTKVVDSGGTHVGDGIVARFPVSREGLTKYFNENKNHYFPKYLNYSNTQIEDEIRKMVEQNYIEGRPGIFAVAMPAQQAINLLYPTDKLKAEMKPQAVTLKHDDKEWSIVYTGA